MITRSPKAADASAGTAYAIDLPTPVPASATSAPPSRWRLGGKPRLCPDGGAALARRSRQDIGGQFAGGAREVAEYECGCDRVVERAVRGVGNDRGVGGEPLQGVARGGRQQDRS